MKSTSVVTNSTGAIQDESDYFPYGGEILLSNLQPQNYKFNGKERDAESGLDEFGARYYNSSWGRFTTPDWAAKPASVPYANFGNPQSLNLYSYVENNPTTMGDPDGHTAPDGNASDGANNGGDPPSTSLVAAWDSKKVPRVAVVLLGARLSSLRWILQIQRVGQVGVRRHRIRVRWRKMRVANIFAGLKCLQTGWWATGREVTPRCCMSMPKI